MVAKAQDEPLGLSVRTQVVVRRWETLKPAVLRMPCCTVHPCGRKRWPGPILGNGACCCSMLRGECVVEGNFRLDTWVQSGRFTLCWYFNEW